MAYEVDLIAAGLVGPEIDRSFWRDAAERRVRALDEDEPMFGLLPSEIAERATLRSLLKGHSS